MFDLKEMVHTSCPICYMFPMVVLKTLFLWKLIVAVECLLLQASYPDHW